MEEMKPCVVEGCAAVAEKRRMCSKHYQRWRKYGDPSAGRRIRNDDRARFLSKVEHAGDCLIWTGWKIWNGYGRFTVAKRHWLAHRWWYEQEVGPIPDGLQLDHLCRNRACVNPAHLEPVTNAENARRGDTGINFRRRSA